MDIGNPVIGRKLKMNKEIGSFSSLSGDRFSVDTAKCNEIKEKEEFHKTKTLLLKTLFQYYPDIDQFEVYSYFPLRKGGGPLFFVYRINFRKVCVEYAVSIVLCFEKELTILAISQQYESVSEHPLLVPGLEWIVED